MSQHRPRVDESNLLFSVIWIIVFCCQIIGEIYPKIFDNGHRVYGYPEALVRNITSLTTLVHALWGYVDQSPPKFRLHLSEADYDKVRRLAVVCNEFGHLIQMVIVHKLLSDGQTLGLKQRIKALHRAIDGLVAVYLEVDNG